MTREEAITQYIMPALKRTWNDDRCIEIISAIAQDPCWDAISRQAVLDAIMANCIWENEYNLTSSSIKKAVESLPPVNPHPKIGHWIDGKCNRCGTHAPYWAMATTYYCSEYCPNCGAKMVEPQERSDKE